MNKVTKFKNGNVVLKYDGQDIDAFYSGEMFMNDLTFEQVGGCWFLVDNNKSLVYNFSDCYTNILYFLDSMLQNTKHLSLRLYPMDLQEGNAILDDVRGGE